uniref:Uncharacterized protein n=1 Tax=Gibberella zeae TaxID=5518 RepID=A0A4E9EM98_GIBZA
MLYCIYTAPKCPRQIEIIIIIELGYSSRKLNDGGVKTKAGYRSSLVVQFLRCMVLVDTDLPPFIRVILGTIRNGTEPTVVQTSGKHARAASDSTCLFKKRIFNTADSCSPLDVSIIWRNTSVESVICIVSKARKGSHEEIPHTITDWTQQLNWKQPLYLPTESWGYSFMPSEHGPAFGHLSI